MDCTPYEVVGPSIPLDVGWGGSKAIGEKVFWQNIQLSTALERVGHE